MLTLVKLLVRQRPGVLFVVEHVWIGHMEDLMNIRLDREHVLRVAEMSLKLGRQVAERLEQVGNARW